MNEMPFFSFYLVLLFVGYINVVIVPLCPCCLRCHFCVLVMHVGCHHYTTSCFYLFKVMLPWFIFFYTNLLFIVFGLGFFFFLLTKLSWPKLTCKVEKVALLSYLFQWKMLLCNIWCLLLDVVTPLRQEQNGKPQHLWRGILGWRRTWQTMKLLLLTWEVWLYQSLNSHKSSWFPGKPNDQANSCCASKCRRPSEL